MAEFIFWIAEHVQEFLAILFTANTILLALVIILENREPERSQGWILVLFAFPIIGFLIYIFFGHNWHRKNTRQRHAIAMQAIEWKKSIKKQLQDLAITNPVEQKLRALATISTGLPPTADNEIRILTNAQEKYPILLDALKNAKTSIDIEYFCFRYDAFGREVIEILKERARAGVTVRFLVDGYGSFGLGAKAFHAMRSAGIHAHFFAPLATLLYFFKANYRDHRKVVIVDRKQVITGGINIGLDYLGQTSRGPWRDTAIELRGPCVAQFEHEFDIAWRRMTYQIPRSTLNEPTKTHQTSNTNVVNVIPSGPDSSWFAIQRIYLEMIHSAEHSVIIQTPYFIPDSSIFEALINTALRGVEVILMTPRSPDHDVSRWVSMTYYGELLRAGVKIHEYTAGFLHQKVTIIDRSIASIGTCNIDIRSLKTDFEINVLISDSKSVQHLVEDAEQDLAASVEYTLKEYLRRPFLIRIRDSLTRLIAPLL